MVIRYCLNDSIYESFFYYLIQEKS